MIIKFLMAEITKYTPEATEEVFIDALPFDVLPAYIHEESKLIKILTSYDKNPKIAITTQLKAGNLLLRRVYTIINACFTLENGILNPVIDRPFEGMIKSSKRITPRGLQKRIGDRLGVDRNYYIPYQEPPKVAWKEWFLSFF